MDTWNQIVLPKLLIIKLVKSCNVLVDSKPLIVYILINHCVLITRAGILKNLEV